MPFEPLPAVSKENSALRPDLILASASPRRKQLLTDAGLRFVIVESGTIEVREAREGAADFASRMAELKALTVARLHPSELVLGADTVVEIDSEVMGKPANPTEAWEMLQKLSARTHTVITGFALARDRKVLESERVFSRVSFRELSADEVRSYIATGEPFDKAGAYAVQGKASSFISRIEGSYTNVMGLPLREVLAALRRQHVMW